MPNFTTNANIKKYVSPVLLASVNHLLVDNITRLFGAVPNGAVDTSGVNVDMIINEFDIETGVGVDDKFGEPVKVADQKTVVPWTNYTTPVYRFSDEEIRKMVYAKENASKAMITASISAGIVHNSLHSVAPVTNADKTPVIEGTGADRGAVKRINAKDVLSLKEAYKGKNYTLVLCKAHLMDLLNDDLDRGDKAILSNLKEGMVTRMFGLNITVNEDINIRYTKSGNKRAMTADVNTEDRQASVLVEKTNTFFKNNVVNASYIGKGEDMTYKVPHSRFRVYGEYIGSVIREDVMRAAIVDGNA